MARNRTQSTVRYSRGPKRDTFWTSFVLAGQQNIGASASIMHTLLTNAQVITAGLIDATIIRTRGTIQLLTDQGGAQEGGAIFFGMKLQNEKARATGATAVPGPFSQPDQDWFVHEILPWNTLGLTAVGVVNPGFERVVDSKAMRKVKGSDSLIFVAENAVALGAIYVFGFHMLVKVG